MLNRRRLLTAPNYVPSTAKGQRVPSSQAWQRWGNDTRSFETSEALGLSGIRKSEAHISVW